MVIVYFNVQGVVDSRDGHCLLYNTLVCVSYGVKGDLWEYHIPSNQKDFFHIFFPYLYY